MLIKDIVKKNLIACDINNNIDSICEVMERYNIGFIPIKNNLDVIGVITDRDIVIRALANKNESLENIITPNIVSIDINKNINDALELLKINKIKRLLVKDNNEYIGVISISDIIRKDPSNIKIITTLQEIYQDEIIIDTDIDDFIL